MNLLQAAADLAGSKTYWPCDYERLTLPVESALGGTQFWRDYEDTETRAFIGQLVFNGHVALVRT